MMIQQSMLFGATSRPTPRSCAQLACHRHPSMNPSKIRNGMSIRSSGSDSAKYSNKALHTSLGSGSTPRGRTPAPPAMAQIHHHIKRHASPVHHRLSFAPSTPQLLTRRTCRASCQPIRSSKTEAGKQMPGPLDSPSREENDTGLLPHEAFPAAINCPPVIQTSRAEKSSDNTEAVKQWMCDRGLTQLQIVKIAKKWPRILTVPHATIQAVTGWLHTEMEWSHTMVAKACIRNPRLFALRPGNLSPKLAWFMSLGFSKGAASRVLFVQPSLFDLSVEHHDLQLLALQDVGLSKIEAVALIMKAPTVLIKDISGRTQQAKLRFLTQAMGRSMLELTNCSAFFCYSLADRLGPRWDYHTLYCPHQPALKLSRLLQNNDKDFTDLECFASSQSLMQECESRSLTRLQIFVECRLRWQQGEGRVWVVEEGKKQPNRQKKKPLKVKADQVTSQEGLVTS